ncbi:hypothetical protein LP416_01840 [Polaromonas sp. P2-4]|nr:hypothetical protein LP416_01840 [Polaromonas sp. P2-4]
MGGTYDDYKSNPDYIDNFSSAGYDPHSKTLHLFFDDGGEAVLTLPLQPSGGNTFLVFERKSLLDNPGPNDRKIYPTSHTQRTLPTVAQWLADHADEMQQSDRLLQAGVGTLDAHDSTQPLVACLTGSCCRAKCAIRIWAHAASV